MNIQKRRITINVEDLIYRIPGLFSFLYEGEKTISTTNPMGCYGCQICDIRLPQTLNVPLFEEGEYIEGINILNGGEVYSFKTLMNIYYSYKTYSISNQQVEEFIKFIDRGIGKFTIKELIDIYNNDKKNITHLDYFSDEEDLVDDVIFLATIDELYKKQFILKQNCEFYNNLKETNKKEFSNLCCDCELFKRKGGDKILILLKYAQQLKIDIALEYHSYAVENIDINIPLFLSTSSIEMGVLTQFRNLWVPGYEYKRGEVVLYENESYICTEDNCGDYDSTYNVILFPTSKFLRIKDINKTSNTNPLKMDNIIDNGDGTYVTNNGIPCDKDGFILKNVIGGTHYENQDENDIKNGYTLQGETSSRLRSLRGIKSFLDKDNNIANPSKGSDWLFYYKKGVVDKQYINDQNGNIMVIDENKENNTSETDYENNNLYVYGNVINDINYNAENETIIFDYSINTHLNANRTITSTDLEGNIIKYCGNFSIDKLSENGKYHGMHYREEFSYPYNGELDSLIKNKEYMTIGGFINLSVYNLYNNEPSNKSITFSEILTLDNFINKIKLTDSPIEYTKDNIVKYKTERGLPCDNEGYAIIINSLTSDMQIQPRITRNGDYFNIYFTFDEYVSGNKLKIMLNDNKYIEFDIPTNKKYEFNTFSTLKTFTKQIGDKDYNYQDNVSSFNINIENVIECEYNNLISDEYLVNIHYQPKIENGVNIERGNAAAFERHLKLLEIKTVEDLENYQNGGFFNIEKSY